jgi:hypothetical protein
MLIRASILCLQVEIIRYFTVLPSLYVFKNVNKINDVNKLSNLNELEILSKLIICQHIKERRKPGISDKTVFFKSILLILSERITNVYNENNTDNTRHNICRLFY